MSRLARKPIPILPGVTLTQKGDVLTAQGPKGTVALSVPRSVKILVEGSGATVSIGNLANPQECALGGLMVRLITNACQGVLQGYEKSLEVQGVGYKAAVNGRTVVLDAGFSHEVRREIPNGLEVTVEKNILTVRGVDKQAVGEFAARLRRVRPPEPYKGKGIRYLNEVVRRKAGKAAKAAGAKAS